MGLKSPVHYIDPKRDPSNPSSWQDILSDEEEKGNDLFALWHKSKIVGMTGILYENANNPANGVAIMTSTQLADNYMGKGFPAFSMMHGKTTSGNMVLPVLSKLILRKGMPPLFTQRKKTVLNISLIV